MNGKVKSLHGVYKALGRDAFLAAAKMYSDHVQKTVEATLAEMESHWYGAEKTMTEADRMVSDFQIGYLTRESAGRATGAGKTAGEVREEYERRF